MRAEIPEERLLNLIKNKNRKKPEEKSVAQPAGASFGFTRAVITFLQKIRTSRLGFLRVLNRCLAVLLVATVGYSVYVFFFAPEYGTVIFPETQEQKAAVGPAGKSGDYFIRPKLGDHAAYSSVIGSRQIFKGGEEAPPPEVVQSANIAGRFTLVGIMPGENPQAIIEDKETGKTYYLYKGTSFDGGIVQEIGSGRVVLECKGEKINLVL